MTIPANGQYTFEQSPIRFFRIKNLVGGTSISVQLGNNGGHFSEMGIGRQIKSAEAFDYVIFKNTTGADITVTFFALDGFEDVDNLLSLDPQTAITIADTTPVKVAVQNFPAAQPVELKLPVIANQVCKSISTAATIHTVAAGKNLYLYGLYTGGSDARIFVTDAANVEQYTLISNSPAVSETFSQKRDFSLPVIIPETYKVKGGGGGLAVAGINGVEL